MLPRYITHPTSISKRARYIGFLVNRNTPLVTSTEESSGFAGSIVVSARRNLKIALAAIISPVITTIIAKVVVMFLEKSKGVAAVMDISHAKTPHEIRITGG
jgi:hypothetical protein